MFDKEKFKSVVHYACASVDDPSKLGATKLNKILWFADVIAFVEFGRSITGAAYVKEKYGPIPRAMLPLIRELTHEGKLRVEEVEYFGKTKRQYVSLSRPDMSAFNKDEMTTIDIVVQHICEKFTASSISDVTHDDIWKLAAIGEEIPMEATLASQLGVVTADDVAWIKDRQKQREAA